MHPVLWNVPLGQGFEIHLYGVFGALGFLAALAFISRMAKHFALSIDAVTNLAVGLVVSGLVGARLFYVVLNWSSFAGDPLAMVNVRDGGLVFLGGVLLAFVYGGWWIRRHKLSFWLLGDIVVPGLALAQAFGRIGCLSAGCCHGFVTQSPWGIVFSPLGVGPTGPGLRFFPSQALESFVYILLFVFLARLLFRRKFEGQVLLAYGIAYAILRFSLEFARGDFERGFVLESLLGSEVLSTSQGICLLLLVPSIAGYLWMTSGTRAKALPTGKL